MSPVSVGFSLMVRVMVIVNVNLYSVIVTKSLDCLTHTVLECSNNPYWLHAQRESVTKFIMVYLMHFSPLHNFHIKKSQNILLRDT